MLGQAQALFAVAQPAFGAVKIGDVPRDAAVAEQRAVIVEEGGAGAGQDHFTAGLVPAVGDEMAEGFLAADEVLEQGPDALRLVGVDEIENVMADHVVGRIAQHVLNTGTDVAVPPAGIDLPDDIGAGLHQRPVAVVRFEAAAQGFPVAGDIDAGDDQVFRLATQQGAGPLDIALLAGSVEPGGGVARGGVAPEQIVEGAAHVFPLGIGDQEAEAPPANFGLAVAGGQFAGPVEGNDASLPIEHQQQGVESVAQCRMMQRREQGLIDLGVHFRRPAVPGMPVLKKGQRGRSHHGRSWRFRQAGAGLGARYRQLDDVALRGSGGVC